MEFRLLSLLVGAVFIGLIGFAGPVRAGTLDDVRERGSLRCGVQSMQPGFSALSEDENWTGLHVDFCRAVAAAIFADGSKVQFENLTGDEGLRRLVSGDIDLLSGFGPWTMSHDTAWDVTFPAVTYFDGQGFLVPKVMGIGSTLELSGATICVDLGDAAKLNLSDYFGSHKMEFVLVEFENAGDAAEAYEDKRCNVYTASWSHLPSLQASLSEPEEHVALPENIAKMPFGPAVRDGDDQWTDLIKWIHFAMLAAEELGLNQTNLDEMKDSGNPVMDRFIGNSGALGPSIGLDPDWAYNIITEVGNYGETFDRNLGPETPLGLTRGDNALSKDGGLHFAPAMR